MCDGVQTRNKLPCHPSIDREWTSSDPEQNDRHGGPHGELAGDPDARRSTPVPGRSVTKTPWLKIDDIFFEARGYARALLHALQPIRSDFELVLECTSALVSLKQIDRELQNTRNSVRSPMILNGIGFGSMANHSLVMASYISRVTAGITDLRSLLQKG
jgi:hypothetical protein